MFKIIVYIVIIAAGIGWSMVAQDNHEALRKYLRDSKDE